MPLARRARQAVTPAAEPRPQGTIDELRAQRFARRTPEVSVASGVPPHPPQAPPAGVRGTCGGIDAVGQVKLAHCVGR